MLAISTLDIPTFTRYVGTAPGTTTLHISGRGNGLGAIVKRIKAGRHGKLIPTKHHPMWWNPYADVSSLRGPSLLGLGDVTSSPWALFVLGLGLSFAGVVGYSYWKRKR